MSNVWPKIKIWSRVVLVALLVIYVIAFIAKNTGETVSVWYWYNTRLQASLLIFSTATFVVGFLAALLVSVTIRTMMHLRQLKPPETKSAPTPPPDAPSRPS